MRLNLSRARGTAPQKANVASATAIAVSAKPQSAGSKESILLTPIAGLGFYAVRAIDKAGSIGPLPLR